MQDKMANAGQHEAGDRTHVCLSMFSEHIADHQFIKSSSDLSGLASEIESRLGELYQAIWNTTQ